jgi:hypothetical protein
VAVVRSGTEPERRILMSVVLIILLIAFCLQGLVKFAVSFLLSGDADAASDSRLGTESCRVNDRQPLITPHDPTAAHQDRYAYVDRRRSYEEVP